MAHGFTVTTLLLRKKTMAMNVTKINKAPPRTPVQMRSTWWFVLDLSLTNFLWDSVGPGITTGEFDGAGAPLVGFNKGEAEGVRNILGGEANGEDIDDSVGDGEGEFDDGDDERGGPEGENIGVEEGESEGDSDGDIWPFWLSLLALDGFGTFNICRNLRYDTSPSLAVYLTNAR